jgi:arginine decarboxylase
VTPYPPGFPVLVPGQVFSREILHFMRDLDTREIHGYAPNFGYQVYTDKAKRSGNGRARILPEVGHDELLGQQQPGDAV